MTFSDQTPSQVLSNAGFSPEQVSSLTNILLPAIEAALDLAFEKHFGLLPQCNQPVTSPKQAAKQKQEQEKEQCSTEKIAEKTTASNNSAATEKGQARSYRASSTRLHLRSRLHMSGNPRAGMQAFQQFAFGNAPPPVSPLGYTRCAEEMESTGQG